MEKQVALPKQRNHTTRLDGVTPQNMEGTVSFEKPVPPADYIPEYEGN
jgi:hypothetical protein